MKTRDTLFFVALILATQWVGVFDHDLWTPDEPRVAAVGKSALAGHWVAPRLGATPFLEQPPLAYWCIGVFYGLFGQSPEHHVRVVNVLFGLGGIALTALLLRFLLNSGGSTPERSARIGLLAAFALGISGEYFATAHRVVVDTALVFFTTAAVYAYARAGISESRSGRWLWCAAGGAGASLAFLSKGPIGVAFPGLFCIALMVLAPPARRMFVPMMSTGLAAFAAIAGPWLWLLHHELGAEAFETLILDNTIDRAVSRSRGHVRPFWMYLWAFPVHFLPATLPLAGALWRRCRRPDSPREGERFAFDLLLLWLGFGLAMLSVASTKRGVYLVPLLPAAAALAAFWLDELLFGEATERDAWMKIFPWTLPAVLAIAAIAAPIGALWLPGASWLQVLPATGVGLVVAAVVCLALARGLVRRGLAVFLVGTFVAVVLAGHALIPPLDRIKSLAEVSREIATLVPENEPIYLYQPDETTEGMLQLYTDRQGVPLLTEADLRAAIEGSPEIWVVTQDKMRRSRHARYETVRPWQVGKPAIEDLRPHSRAIRLVRASREVKADTPAQDP